MVEFFLFLPHQCRRGQTPQRARLEHNTVLACPEGETRGTNRGHNERHATRHTREKRASCLLAFAAEHTLFAPRGRLCFILFFAPTPHSFFCVGVPSGRVGLSWPGIGLSRSCSETVFGPGRMMGMKGRESWYEFPVFSFAFTFTPERSH